MLKKPTIPHRLASRCISVIDVGFSFRETGGLTPPARLVFIQSSFLNSRRSVVSPWWIK
jgi:hypothetical protein